MKRVLAVSLCVCFISGVVCADTFGSGGNQFNINFVNISGATNPTSGYGIVNNGYRMGTYEITNDQWTKFKTNLGVTVTGTPSTAYDANPTWTGTNVPTNQVSWYEAAQFVNWLNTNRGYQAAYKFTGTQGTSGYTLGAWQNGDVGYNAGNPYRNSNAFYFMPTEDEWVKAAYWNGTNLQTYSNASAGDLISGSPDPAKWNYYPSAGSEPWAVGSGVKELNGTFDMMGNVWEWMESPYTSGSYLSTSSRGVRGGSYYISADGLLGSSSQLAGYPDLQDGGVGFRVASVPEPATLALFGLGGLMLRKRRA